MATFLTPHFPFLLFGLALVLWRILRKRSLAPLPPGPKKLPIIGNLLDLPTKYQWLRFAEWGDMYGDIISTSVFGQHYIIVNSAQTAFEMLEGKSRIYSDRPVVFMASELMGWKNASAFIQYGNRFRNHRRMFHQIIGTHGHLSRYHHVEQVAVRRFLRYLASEPEGLLDHIRRTVCALMLRISHGYEVKEANDPFVRLADLALEYFSTAVPPGSFLVNIIPILRFLPDWFPGAGFKQFAKEGRKLVHDMVEGSFQYTKRQMELGTAEFSMLSSLLEEESKSTEEQVSDIKWACASLYAGGSDTNVATLYGFFKAMVLYPDVQAKAQSEIDAVIGNERLPTFEDREMLPFVSALVLEVFRWHVVGPSGGPHRVMEDDIHDGYLIPKGAVVLPNVWRMCRDPNVYKSPDLFDPARFIKTEDHEAELDPRSICFGFGRRICPGGITTRTCLIVTQISIGRLLAYEFTFLACAMSLSVFNIAPYKDEDGGLVMPDLKQGAGLISHPSKFRCNIVPRSEKALALINAD